MAFALRRVAFLFDDPGMLFSGEALLPQYVHHQPPRGSERVAVSGRKL